jgi:hypothetical protein
VRQLNLGEVRVILGYRSPRTTFEVNVTLVERLPSLNSLGLHLKRAAMLLIFARERKPNVVELTRAAGIDVERCVTFSESREFCRHVTSAAMARALDVAIWAALSEQPTKTEDLRKNRRLGATHIGGRAEAPMPAMAEVSRHNGSVASKSSRATTTADVP